MSTNGHLLFFISILTISIKLSVIQEITNRNFSYILISGLIGSILPDIDYPLSYIGKIFPYISNIIYRIFGHRGFTHSFLFIIIIIYLFKFSYNIQNELINNCKKSFLLGYCSHIIADLITKNGIKLFWPCKLNFSFPIIKKNQKKTEYIIFIILIIYSILTPNK